MACLETVRHGERLTHDAVHVNRPPDRFHVDPSRTYSGKMVDRGILKNGPLRLANRQEGPTPFLMKFAGVHVVHCFYNIS